MAMSASCGRLPDLHSPLATKIEAIAKARAAVPGHVSTLTLHPVEPEPIVHELVGLAESAGVNTGHRTASRQMALYILAEAFGIRQAAKMLHTIPNAVLVAQGRFSPIVASLALAIEPTAECFSTLFAAFTDGLTAPPRSRKELILLVSKAFDVSVTDMLAARRDFRVVFPRQVGMYLCKRFTTSSYPAIGKSFNRDHTTALHAVRKIEDLIEFHALKAEETPMAWIDALQPLRPA